MAFATQRASRAVVRASLAALGSPRGPYVGSDPPHVEPAMGAGARHRRQRGEGCVEGESAIGSEHVAMATDLVAGSAQGERNVGRRFRSPLGRKS
jgi:hypothetical protein